MILEDLIGAAFVLVSIFRPFAFGLKDPGWVAFEDAFDVTGILVAILWIRAIRVVWKEEAGRPRIREVGSGLYLPNNQLERHFERDEPVKYYGAKLVIIGGVFLITLVGALVLVHILVATKTAAAAVTTMQPQPIQITPGTTWRSLDYYHGLHFLRVDAERITPLNVMADYTITNTKSTPIMITQAILEVQDQHDNWWKLKDLPTTMTIIMGDMKTPAEVGEVTLKEGFLMNKIQKTELAPGQSVEGWLLCQYPSDYVPRPQGGLAGIAHLRLTVKDTAGDTAQSLGTQENNNAMYTEMQYVPLPGENLSRYKIVPFGD